MRSHFAAAALAAAMAVCAPTMALAGDRDNARVAIAEAKAKLDMNEKTGITGEAADIQSRGRMALDKAQKEFKHSDEDGAQAAAREASALAELAATTQQKQMIEGQTALTAAQPN